MDHEMWDNVRDINRLGSSGAPLEPPDPDINMQSHYDFDVIKDDRYGIQPKCWNPSDKVLFQFEVPKFW